jgi:UDP-glucose 4-epimerase
MNVLITGGAGFIGSAVARDLLTKGHRVRVFDNLETGNQDNLPDGVEFALGDIRDEMAVARVVSGCDAVIHLAAMVSVARSVAEPENCWNINVMGTRIVLEAARKAGCRRLVLASSAAVYGNEPTMPKRETMPPMPESPYAYSKWLNEVDAGYYGQYLGLATVCFRFFNVFGPRQRPESPYSGVISIAAGKLLAGEPFTVFGTGEQTRDFVYVDDVASAVVAGLTRPGIRHAVLNVGRGQSISLLELLKLMGQAIGQAPELRFAESRAGDVLHSEAEASQLEALLGVRAETPLDRGVTEMLAWMRGAASSKA